jgi:photosystem II PsbJ protein
LPGISPNTSAMTTIAGLGIIAVVGIFFYGSYAGVGSAV